MPGKQDRANELAAKLIETLTRQRAQGGDAYPLPLQRLAALADPGADRSVILAAVNPRRKAFGQHAVAARPDLRAPVALLVDQARLAESPGLLEFLLDSGRTATNHASTVAKLKGRLTHKLQKPFQEAAERRIAEGTLPATVGWVLMNRTRALFLLTDLHTCRRAAGPAAAPVETYRPAPAVEFVPAFHAAFDRLDRRTGGHNFVSLVDLRRELPHARPAFDAGLRHLRVEGRYTLSAVEGRQGLRDEEREAAVTEDGALLLYVSRKSP